MKSILIIFCGLLFCGCAGPLGKSISRYDPVEAVEVNQLTGNNLTRSPFAQTVVYLNAHCQTKRDGQKSYFLFTELIAPADFVLQSGESLILNLDDQVLAFAPTNAPSFNGRKRFTTTFYAVQPEVLVKLAGATTARVRIKGTNTLIDKRLSPRNSRSFLDFAEKFSLLPKLEPAGG